jgi:hypothetical protein
MRHSQGWDNVVAFDKEEQQHVKHVRQLLCLCEEKRIFLNCGEFKLSQTEVQFAGFKLMSTSPEDTPSAQGGNLELPHPKHAATPCKLTCVQYK